MEVEFDIEIPKAEQAFIAMHLEGSKVNAARELSMQDQNLIRLQAIVDDFISGYDPQIQMQLRKDDQFLQGLLTHMEPALVRIKNHLPIYNPLLFQLKEQYGELFEATRQAADRIETLYALPISDEEAGFITMHVGASLERTALHASLRPVRIGVVCASGIGVSALLAARIEKKFGQDVKLQTLSLEDVRLQNTGLNELLLSTFPVELPGIETIQVSPLLTDQDIHRIQLRLETIERKELPAPASPGSYPRLLDHLEARIQAQKTVLAGMQTIPVRAPSSKNDLIFMAAASLNGSTKPLYQDLLKREKLGAVVAEDYGFALFHATSFAASQIQMLFLYPENGQTFDSVPGFESIRMVIAAILPEGATEEDRQTLSLLFAAFIERPGFLAACLSGNLVQIKEQICPLFQQNLFEAFEAF